MTVYPTECPPDRTRMPSTDPAAIPPAEGSPS